MNKSTLIPNVTKFFDQDTSTFSYVVADPSSNNCAVIDSVLNLDYASGSLTTEGADEVIRYVEEHKLKVEWLIETHVHADHVSAAAYIQEKLGGKIGIGSNIATVQKTFAKIFNEAPDFPSDGSQFDYLFSDDEHYKIGNLEAVALHTPGHTPACMTHIIGDAAFVGDTIFMPDGGTARADFPGGSAEQLFGSIQKILQLDDDVRLFMCHDYSEDNPAESFLCTVSDERNTNIHVHQGVSEADFIKMRETRDKTLDMPRYILPSLQINMRAGHVPDPEGNGLSYLKIPINAFN